MAEHLYFKATEQRIEIIHSLCDKTGLGVGELLRRILDYSFQEDSLNIIVPSMSGQLRINQIK